MAATGTVVEAPAPPMPIRGGVSVAGVVTGALVAYAAGILFVLGARAIGDYAGYRPFRLPIGGMHRTGLVAAVAIGAGVGLALGWGGYAAARMGRGKGWLNGLLVPFAAGAIGALGLGVAALLRPGPGVDLHLHLPSGYPHLRYVVPAWILGAGAVGIALLAAATGGALGARWHTMLERRVLKEEAEVREARQSFADLREAMAEPTPSLLSPADVIAPPSIGQASMAPGGLPTVPLVGPFDRGLHAGP